MTLHRSCFSLPMSCVNSRNQTVIRRLYSTNLLVVTLAIIGFLVFKYEMAKITYRQPYLLETLSSQSELLHSWLTNNSMDSLQTDSPAVSVHYLWCRKGHFEFKHYLSILSILKSIQPDQIVFHYTELPIADPKGYVTWFEDIQRDVPFLLLKKTSHSRYCGHSFYESMNFDLSDYNNPVGIFVTDDIAVVNYTRKDFVDFAKTAQKHSKLRVFFFPFSEPFSIPENDGVKVMKCPSMQEYHKRSSETNQYSCVQVTERLSPTDTWSRKEYFYTFARMLVYGTKNLQPHVNERSLVPLICHVLHFTDSTQFDYIAYSSVLSALYVGKMRHVYIHSDHVPSGSLYEEIITRHNVTFVHVPHVHRFHPELGDILYGAYILLRHGGIVLRSDTIWRKEMSHDLQTFDSVATLRRSVYRIINYSLDLSVLISKANSKFLKMFLSTLRQTPKKHSKAKSEEVAYRVFLETPQSVKLNSTLIQHVTCSKNLCQPNPEDVGARRAVLVQMTWLNGRPKTESDVKAYHGFGLNLLKPI